MSPLNGYTVIELAGIGPAPMAGMMLADMGAEVIRIERSTSVSERRAKDVSLRGKKSVMLDLKDPRAVRALLQMIESADVLIDPYRPLTCEKLGIGPDECLSRNPRLVFARMTGWGQHGPQAMAAGHDINYIALTGALHAIGRAGERPVVPLNLVGDMGGGGTLLVVGILAALLETRGSGKGQVVDCAMVDGAIQQMWMFQGMLAAGAWDDGAREANLLDGGAYFYDCYECADGRYISLGAIEPQFHATMITLLGLDPGDFADQHDKTQWPALKQAIAAAVRTKTRDEWCRIMEGTDACFAPVLRMSEAPAHPANVARECFVEIDGVVQAVPAPRFSRTPSRVRRGAPVPGEHTAQVLAAMGIAPCDVAALAKGVGTGGSADAP
ncbi:CoA transferase [Sphingobium sp. JS3065]|uniref:CaiB/BaiF CoA transferase family protein n=1 Tax=Sphingobium sp. JS3065 TaxID=2970925 RepID=UPI002263D0A7|nr:CaiB/BaiF CoA-transferase family protein [Sphingobium sp. JS3065]UZW55997.1 CoA transferase [Sphingobium sp. JS3065]